MRQRCEGCPNRSEGTVFGRGQLGGIAIVGQAPGPTEVRRGQIFTGISGRLLHECVKQAELDEVYYTNAISCATFEDPTTEQINACRQSLLSELKQVQPKRILLMGNAAIQSMFPGAPAISQLRPDRLWHDELQTYCIPTMNAAAALHDPEVFRDITYDFEILSNLTSDLENRQWSIERPPPFVVVDSMKTFLRFLAELDRETTHLSYDIETTGLDCFTDDILTLGISDGRMNWMIEYDFISKSDFAHRNLKMLLEDPQLNWGGHNAPQFDWKFTWQKLRIDIALKWDTMLQHVTLDERNTKGLHKLKPLLRRFLCYPAYAEDIEGRYENYGDIPRDLLYQYQAWDTQGTWELHEVLDSRMWNEDPDLVKLHDEVLVPGAKALAIVEMNGICIDVPYLQAVGQQIDAELHEIQLKLQKMTDDLGVTNLSQAIDTKIAAEEHLAWAVQEQAAGRMSGRDRIAVRKAYTQARDAVPQNTFNPNSSLQVKKLITQTLRLTNDTTKEGLEAISHRHPAPKLIAEYRVKQKLKGTYVDGLAAKVHPRTGRIHGNFLPNGARTGRLSAQDPNWQNVPVLVGPVIRNGVIPTPGWRFGEVDNSQVELRIAAVFSQDERLIGVYRDGRDVHREVAVTMYHKPADEITDRERYNAKYVDFPILFGATAESLVGTGDPPWDLATAKQFVDGFLNGFPQMHEWMEHQKRFVREHGYVKTLFGRYRRYPLILDQNVGDIERQSINSPIQGSASDLCFTALQRIVLELFEREKRGEPVECRILLTVHDSIGFEAVAGKEEFYGMWIRQQMEIFPQEWEHLGLPFKSEIKLGDRWGSCHEFNPKTAEYWNELDEFTRRPWTPRNSDIWVERVSDSGDTIDQSPQASQLSA